ncbi:MAG: fatty acid desaturase, partial [Caulobacteraceae bacterium]
FMHVPCWRLARLHRAVGRTDAAGGMEIAPGYAAVLKQATRAA